MAQVPCLFDTCRFGPVAGLAKEFYVSRCVAAAFRYRDDVIVFQPRRPAGLRRRSRAARRPTQPRRRGFARLVRRADQGPLPEDQDHPAQAGRSGGRLAAEEKERPVAGSLLAVWGPLSGYGSSSIHSPI